MSEFNIEVESGKSVRLPTAGKYCDRDIVVKATGSGTGEGYDEGYEAGQRAEYDRFWDDFQNSGNKVAYYQCFGHGHWNMSNYKPKYSITCTKAGTTSSATNIFYNARSITNTLVPILVYNIPLNATFGQCAALETIPLLGCYGVTEFKSTFNNCTALKNITIDGSIDVNFSISATAVLTNDSVQSIIEHLKDLTGLDTQTLTLHQTVGEKLTEEQKAAVTAKNWTLAY